jgi:hypothetical protein
MIGCRILTQPFFFPEEQWIAIRRLFVRSLFDQVKKNLTCRSVIVRWLAEERQEPFDSGWLRVVFTHWPLPALQSELWLPFWRKSRGHNLTRLNGLVIGKMALTLPRANRL